LYGNICVWFVWQYLCVICMGIFVCDLYGNICVWFAWQYCVWFVWHYLCVIRMSMLCALSVISVSLRVNYCVSMTCMLILCDVCMSMLCALCDFCVSIAQTIRMSIFVMCAELHYPSTTAGCYCHWWQIECTCCCCWWCCCCCCCLVWWLSRRWQM